MKRALFGLCFLFSAAVYLFYFDSAPSDVHARIIYELRLPRLLTVISIGALLSSIGASYQVLFSNPLAEPYVLGVSSAVALAAASAETFFGISLHSGLGIGIAVLGSLLCAALLMAVSQIHKGLHSERIVLFGMGVNFVFSSLLFLLLSYASQQLGGGAMRWLFGQIPWLSTPWSVCILGLAIVLTLVLVMLAPKLDALAFGDSVARTYGVNPVRTRNLVIFITSIAVGLTVSQTGSIGFVGLVVPHIARLLFKPNSTRQLIVSTTLIGALFLLLSDFVSRNLLPPMEFPIGTVTTLLGGPLFLWLLWNR